MQSQPVKPMLPGFILGAHSLTKYNDDMDKDAYTVGLVMLLIILSLTLGILSLYAHTIMPGLKHLDDATFVKSFQSIDNAIINPIFMLQFFVPIVLFPVLYLTARSHDYAGSGYVLAAAVAYVTVLILTIGVNVPLNDAIKKINPQSSADTLAQARAAFKESRWILANLLRTIADGMAVIFIVFALIVRK